MVEVEFRDENTLINTRDKNLKILLVLLFILVILANLPVSAYDLDLFIDGITPLYSDYSYNATFTWSGIYKEFWFAGPVTLVFCNENQKELWSDTHVPPIGSINQFKTDWTISYTIPIYIPPLKKDQKIKIYVSYAGSFLREMFGIKVLRKSCAPEPPNAHAIKPLYGWYNLEQDSVSGKTWRWMAGSSRTIIPNPYKTCTLFIKGSIPRDKNTNEVVGVHVFINGSEIDYFIPSLGEFSVRYRLPLSLLGYNNNITLDLKVDKTFNSLLTLEKNNNERQLGLRLDILQIK